MKQALLHFRLLTRVMLCAIFLPAAMADSPGKPLLEIHLRDGSLLKGEPVEPGLEVNSRLGGTLNLQWAALEELDLEKGPQAAQAGFANGDRLTVSIVPGRLEVSCVLGVVQVPVSSIGKIGIMVLKGDCSNVALGKPVHGQDGASNGKGLARHVTDGDLSTHAKPPASSFDFRIDLQAGREASFTIHEIVIHWGRFGDEFKGVRKPGTEQWGNAAWPGKYVTEYTVECRSSDKSGWQAVHHFKGSPVHESAPGVVVEKQPSKEPGCTTDSVTHLQGLQLERVVELRIRASGGHWIGLHELQAFGCQEVPGTRAF